MTTRFSEEISDDVDANANSVTVPLNISENARVSLLVKHRSGSHNVHQTALEGSLDKIIWNQVSDALTGLGTINDKVMTTKWARAKIKTPQGGASKVDIIIQAK